MLDLFKDQSAAAAEYASLRPVEGLDPGGGGALSASLNAIFVSQSHLSDAGYARDAVQRRLDAYHDATGETLPNPLLQMMPPGMTSFGQAGLPDPWAVVTSKYNAWASTTGQDPFPTSEQISQEVLAGRRADYTADQSALSNIRTGGARVGQMVGGILGSLTDPLVIASMGVGAGWSAGILRTILVEAGINFGSQFVSDLARMGQMQQFQPDYGIGDVLTDSLATGALGGILGGGVKALAAAWRGVRDIRPWPRSAVDAGNVVDRSAANVVRATTPAEETTVTRAAATATRNVGDEVPVTRPADAAAAANSRVGRVFDADGRQVDVQYEVVPAASLVASNGADGVPNPAFPAELQPRDRTRAASQEQVNNIARNLNPDLLGPSPRADSGAPIIGPDNVVESGNGRVMGVMQAYRENGAAAARYKASLASQGYDASGIEDPVLVARRTTPLQPDERVAFSAAANRATAARMAPAEQAGADARLLGPELLSRLTDGDVASAGNRNFVRGFVDQLPVSERGELVDRDGGLSVSGVRRVQSALMARAYGDPILLGRALEDADNNIKSLAGALSDVAGPWAIMRDAVAHGALPKGMDITDDVVGAVRTVMEARDGRRAVYDLANQGEMFGGPSETQKLLLRGMFNDEGYTKPAARSRVSAMLSGYATEARKNTADDRLFGEPLGQDAILATSLAKAGREDLAEAARDRLTPEAIEKADGDLLADSAVVRAAEELRMEQRKPGEGLRTIPWEIGRDAEDNPVYGDMSLDQLMDEADMELQAAKEIEGCATGAMAEAAE